MANLEQQHPVTLLLLGSCGSLPRSMQQVQTGLACNWWTLCRKIVASLLCMGSASGIWSDLPAEPRSACFHRSATSATTFSPLLTAPSVQRRVSSGETHRAYIEDVLREMPACQHEIGSSISQSEQSRSSVLSHRSSSQGCACMAKAALPEHTNEATAPSQDDRAALQD